MGSVQSDCECPECHYEHAMSDYYYKIGMEYVHCGRCGYYHGYDENHKEITEKGIGSYRIYSNGGGTIGSMLDKKHLKEFKKSFENGEFVNGNGDKPTEVTYTIFKDGKWQIHNLVDNSITDFPEHPEWYDGKE